MKLVSATLTILLLTFTSFAERFSGSGPYATKKFNLTAGLHVCEIIYNHAGGYFGVSLHNSSGDRELLVNEVGGFNGKMLAVASQNDSYFFNIDAERGWQINVSKPGLQPSRRSFNGRGSDVSPIIELGDGVWQFKMTHKGRSNFFVKLWAEDGSNYDRLALSSGIFDGSKALNLKKGKYVIEIVADGDWTVNVKPHE